MVCGDGEGCGTCRFWTRAFCGKCCCCCPTGCETSCLNCFRGCQNWIYCLQKYLCILVAIPKAILWVIKEIFCCLMLYLLLGLIFALVIFLLRFFCDQVLDFLDFLFVSGGGGGGGIFPFTQAAATNLQYTWNTFVPYFSPIVVITVDTLLSIHQTLTTEIGTQQMEELFLDLSANTHVLTEMLFNVLSAIVESDPEDLVGLSLISKELTMRSIESHSFLLNSFDLSTGGGWAAIVPLIYSANQLALGAALASGRTGRTLLSFNDTTTTTTTRSPYDTMGTSYIQSIQRGYQDLSGQCDIDEVIRMAQDTAQKAQSIRQTTQGRGPSATGPRKHQRDERLEVMAGLLRRELEKSLRSYNEKKTRSRGGSESVGKRLLASVGFESLDGLVNHVRSEYGDGRGFLYSLAPHKRLEGYTRPYKEDEESPYKSQIHFSDYLAEAGMTGKEYAEMTAPSSSSATQRKPLQIIPVPLDILDCFTDVPPDPLCILGFLLPLPLDPPPFLEPVLDFDCACDDYDPNCFGLPALQNSLLVLQTIVSLFSSIEALGVQDFFMSITLPDFIVDNLFLLPPGDAPDTSDILCAILHMDCFLLVVVVAGFLLLLLFGVLRVICDVWNCLQDLRLLNEHEKIYRMTCVKMRKSEDVDRLLAKYLNDSLANPGVRDYGDPYHYGKPEGFWREDVEGSASGDRPIVYGAASEEWYPRMYPGDKGPSAYQRTPWRPTPIGGQMLLEAEEAEAAARPTVPHHVLTTHLQTKMLHDANENLSTPVGSYRMKRMYHILHPEERSDYRRHTIRSISEELLSELGKPLDASEISSQDRHEITQSETTPYLFHENTSVFGDHTNSVLAQPSEERTLLGGLRPYTVFEYFGLR